MKHAPPERPLKPTPPNTVPNHQKDLEQPFDLQAVLKKLGPESLSEAFESARGTGPGWKRTVDAGQNAMRRLFG